MIFTMMQDTPFVLLSRVPYRSLVCVSYLRLCTLEEAVRAVRPSTLLSVPLTICSTLWRENQEANKLRNKGHPIRSYTLKGRESAALPVVGEKVFFVKYLLVSVIFLPFFSLLLEREQSRST